MTAVWIIGFSFLIVGLVFCVPRYIRFIKCRGRTRGIMTRVQPGTGTGSQPARATYEYVVDGTRYVKSTGWTGNGIFRLGRECDVCYNVSKPEQSYLRMTGQIINCVIGTIFALAGLGVLCLGLLLMHILP